MITGRETRSVTVQDIIESPWPRDALSAACHRGTSALSCDKTAFRPANEVSQLYYTTRSELNRAVWETPSEKYPPCREQVRQSLDAVDVAGFFADSATLISAVTGPLGIELVVIFGRIFPRYRNWRTGEIAKEEIADAPWQNEEGRSSPKFNF